MTPSEILCGVLCAFQSVFWKPLKKAADGFIQGMTKDELKVRIKKRTKQGWKAISLDGSAFDSTQNSDVMKVVDNKFF